MILTAEVIEIKGTCSAGLKIGDTMVWTGSCVSGVRICATAVKTVATAATRVMLEAGLSGVPVVSCLDPGHPYTAGGCVLLRLQWDPPVSLRGTNTDEPGVIIRVVESHSCPEGLEPGDRTVVRGRVIDLEASSKICAYALAHLAPLLAQVLPAHPGGRTVTHGACPSGGRCGRVIFQVVREGTGRLGDLVLHYQRALAAADEARQDTGKARSLSEKSMAAQRAGNMEAGIRLLDEAISVLTELRQDR